MEKEIVKIRTNKGRIITLSVTGRTNGTLIGIDKFGKDTIISFSDIAEMLPLRGDSLE